MINRIFGIIFAYIICNDAKVEGCYMQLLNLQRQGVKFSLSVN